MGMSMNFYPWVRIQISNRSLCADGCIITLPDLNPTHCHSYDGSNQAPGQSRKNPPGNNPHQMIVLSVVLSCVRWFEWVLPERSEGSGSLAAFTPAGVQTPVLQLRKGGAFPLTSLKLCVSLNTCPPRFFTVMSLISTDPC
jgi:hypothetical protein